MQHNFKQVKSFTKSHSLSQISFGKYYILNMQVSQVCNILSISVIPVAEIVIQVHPDSWYK